MRTAVISDLHLGKRAGNDLLARPAAREALFAGIAGVEQVVLLGDVLELRDLAVAEVLERARPFLDELGEALEGARVVIVPGNHDHQLASEWLERRRQRARPPKLGLEEITKAPTAGLMARIARRLPRNEVLLAYPGTWIRDDVYATHGHYLDCHNTVPSFEALAAATTVRLTGRMSDGELSPDDYEAALAPIYAFAYALAQGLRPAQGLTDGVSVRVWQLLNGRDGRLNPARLVLGGILVPTAVAAINLTGVGPFESDLSGAALRRAGLRGMEAVVERLRIEAEHVIFGHTHRSGPLPDDDEGWTLPGGTRLTNSGSWLHEPAFIGDRGRASPYWPGTCVIVDDEGPPRLERLLERLPGPARLSASRMS